MDLFFYLSKLAGFVVTPTNALILLLLVGVVTLRWRFGRRLAALAAVLLVIWRAVAARQSADRAAGAALSALGCQPGRAGRHHRAGRGARRRGVRCRRRARPQRGGRAHDRGGGAGAGLSERALLFSGGEGTLVKQRRNRGRGGAGVLRAHGACAGAHRGRGPLAQHHRERGVHEGAGQAQARRALARSSPPPGTCRARSAASARRASRWRPIRWISARRRQGVLWPFFFASDGLRRLDWPAANGSASPATTPPAASTALFPAP